MTVAWWSFGAALALGLVAAVDLVQVVDRRRGRHRRLALRRSRVHPLGSRHLADRIGRTRVAADLGARLAAAGIDVEPVRAAGVALGSLAAVGIAVARVASPALALGATAVAVLAGRAVLRRRTDRRREDLIAQLPDLARLLSSAAGAGLALRSGLELAAREIAEPARSELRRVVAALEVGESIEEALGAMARRLPSREISVLVTTLVVQQRAGGRIIGALRAVAVALEDRKEVRREVRTLMAGAVSSTYLVVGMGVGSVLLLELATPGVLDELLGSGPGRLAVGTSAALDLLGLAAIRRLSRIDV